MGKARTSYTPPYTENHQLKLNFFLPIIEQQQLMCSLRIPLMFSVVEKWACGLGSARSRYIYHRPVEVTPVSPLKD